MRMRVLLIVLAAASCAIDKGKDSGKFLTITPPPANRPVEVFTTESTHEWLIGLVKVANCAINRPEVKAMIAAADRFDFTEDDGGTVASKVGTVQSEVRLYKSALVAYAWRRFWPGIAPVNGYVMSGDPTIWLNTRTNPRDTESMVESLCHEHGHVIGYGHGPNGAHTTGVPNELAKICKKHIGGCW